MSIKRSNTLGGVSFITYIIPFSVGFILLFVSLLTQFTTQNQDVRSKAVLIYSTPTPTFMCRPCTTKQTSRCQFEYIGIVCASDGIEIPVQCLERCFEPSYRSCSDGRTQKCEKFTLGGCSNIYYWSPCSSNYPTVTPTRTPTPSRTPTLTRTPTPYPVECSPVCGVKKCAVGENYYRTCAYYEPESKVKWSPCFPYNPCTLGTPDRSCLITNGSQTRLGTEKCQNFKSGPNSWCTNGWWVCEDIPPQS